MVRTPKSCTEYALLTMLGAECIINLNHRVSRVIFYLFTFVFVFPCVYFSFYFIFLFLKYQQSSLDPVGSLAERARNLKCIET